MCVFDRETSCEIAEREKEKKHTPKWIELETKARGSNILFGVLSYTTKNDATHIKTESRLASISQNEEKCERKIEYYIL